MDKEYELFIDKFEIPLTTRKTEQVFDNIIDNGNYIDSKLIKNVYMPIHFNDGTSGRPFDYRYDKEEYIDLIKRILEHKPIVITYPYGNPDIIEKYIKLGINDFMVSFWKDEYKELKKKYKQLKLFRSIVYNSKNEEINENFDGFIIPYHKMLDIEWVKEKSKKFLLIGLTNHSCRINCPYIETHIERELMKDVYKLGNIGETTSYKILRFMCPDDNKLFLPRQVVLKLLPYLYAIKLIERTEVCYFYERYIEYYTKNINLRECKTLNSDFFKEVFNDNAKKHELYEQSNLVNLNCQFKCDTCNKKCY